MTATFGEVVKWLSVYVKVTPCYVLSKIESFSISHSEGWRGCRKKGQKIAVILVAQCMALAPEHMLQNLYEAYE